MHAHAHAQHVHVHVVMTCAPRAATKQPRLGTHIYTYIHIYAYLEEPRLECLVDDDVVPGEGVRGRGRVLGLGLG